MKPKLRDVRIHPMTHNGQRGFLLEDPLRLSQGMIFVPQALAPVLALMDGTRTLSGIQAGLRVRTGIYIPTSVLERLVADLDAALMLDNERFAAAREAALREYRQAPYRPPSHADAVYPSDPEAFTRTLDAYVQQVEDLPPHLDHPIRGVVSPHIDYQRGGVIYAGVWTYAADAVRSAQRVVVLGTDHNGDFGTLTLTRQNYATPLGVLPTDQAAVDALVEAIGEENAFREELHHRGEHSIELALAWVHYIRKGAPVDVVPILMGSFAHFVQGVADPAKDPILNRAVAVLQALAADKPTLFVAAGDLAHVGPAFGDPYPWGPVEKARLRAADKDVMETITRGDAEAFFQTIAAVEDRYRICGLPPIYLLLRVLEGATGVVTGYDQCPADEQNGSVVSVCGAAIG